MEFKNRDTMDCPCHAECTECIPEFRKVIDLKNIGIVIYRHSTRTEDDNAKTGNVEHAVNTTEDIYILHNTKDTDITSADYGPEIEQNTIQCPRCRKFKEHAQKLLKKGPTISGNDVKGICNHCKMNDASCYECQEVVKKFVPGKSERTDIAKEREKHWLGKIKHLLEDTRTSKDKKWDLCDMHIDQLCRQLTNPEREPDVEQLFAPHELDSSSTIRTYMDKKKVAHLSQPENLETPNVFRDTLKKGVITFSGYEYSNVSNTGSKFYKTMPFAKFEEVKYDIKKHTASPKSREVEAQKEPSVSGDRRSNETNLNPKANLYTKDCHDGRFKTNNSTETIVNKVKGITKDHLKQANNIVFPRRPQCKYPAKHKSSSELIISITEKLQGTVKENKSIGKKFKQANQKCDINLTKHKTAGKTTDTDTDLADIEKRSSGTKTKLQKAPEPAEKVQTDAQNTENATQKTDKDPQKAILKTYKDFKIAIPKADNDSQKAILKAEKDVHKSILKADMDFQKATLKTDKDPQKAILKPDKVFQKATLKANNDSQKSILKAEKDTILKVEKDAILKAERDAQKAFLKGVKDAKKAENDAQKAFLKGDKDAKKAENDTHKSILKAEKDAQKAFPKGDKDAKKASLVAEKNAKKSVKDTLKTERDIQRAFLKAEKDTKKAENVQKAGNHAQITKNNTQSDNKKALRDAQQAEIIALRDAQKSEKDDQEALNKTKLIDRLIEKAKNENKKLPKTNLDKIIASLPENRINTEEETKNDSRKIKRVYLDDLIFKLIQLKQLADEGRLQHTCSDLRLTKKYLDIHCTQHTLQKSENCLLCANSDIALEFESLGHDDEIKDDINDMIIGQKIVKFRPHMAPSEDVSEDKENEKKNAKISNDITAATTNSGPGYLRYSLSDRKFIDNGWTQLPTEKVLRKMNVYRMRPAHPEFDWFKHNKNKQLMQYDTGEKLAEFDDNGCGRWYYRNGRVALVYYDAEACTFTEQHAGQRFVIYSNGEPDERGRSRPYTLLATFDYLGNGIVFDHGGKIRLKYNQTEGVVLDRSIGPVSHWKWHTLNDPPVLQQVMIDTQIPHKDPEIMKMGKPGDEEPRYDDDNMLAIEFNNIVKEKSKKLTQTFKPFQIRMKALKINEHFSLRVLDQATVYLLYRDGTTNLKLNIGMVLDSKEIVDTDMTEVGEVSNNFEKLPARTESLAGLQKSIVIAQQYERMRTERERKLHPSELNASADKLVAVISRPLPRQSPSSVVSGFPSIKTADFCKCHRKPTATNVYYDTRFY